MSVLFRRPLGLTHVFPYPGSTPHYAPDRTFDTRHSLLELVLDFPRKTLKGQCVTTLQAVADRATEMVFDAVDFKDLKVSSRSKALKFDYTGRQIKIHWPAPVKRGTQVVEVVIGYRVTQPKLGLQFIGPDRHYPKKPVQAWTQGEDEYNRYWFPCHDAPQERMTTEMIITVPAKFTAISNGALPERPLTAPERLFERSIGSITFRIHALSRLAGGGRIFRDQGQMEACARALLLSYRGP